MLARMLLMTVAGVLMSIPPAQAVSELWQAEARPDGATQYSCGEACGQTQLICVHEIVPDQQPVRIEDIADEAVTPWEQIDYSLIFRMAGDRGGAAGAGKNINGKRLKGPVIVSFGGADWVSAEYQIGAKAGDLEAQALLWPVKEGVSILRCGYNGAADNDGAVVAVRQLAESLRLTP